MGRVGDAVVFTVSIEQLIKSAELQVELFTKNSEDPGDGTAVANSSTGFLTAAGVVTNKTVKGGLEELVRYRYTIKASEGQVSGVLFRMLTPTWYDTVEGS